MVKKLVVKKGIECQACKACMQACSNAYFKTFDEALSCIQLGERNGAVKPVVCSQCGKCAEACPENAITQNSKGVYTINKKLCKACGKCVEACPFHVAFLADGAAAASKCVACGLCAKACPMEILEIVVKE